MRFEKTVMFLGFQQSETPDHKQMLKVALYEVGGDPLSVYVVKGDNNGKLFDSLLDFQSGDMIHVTFVLREAEKRFYKLGLVDVAV